MKGNIAGLMQQAQKMQQEMQKAKEELAKLDEVLMELFINPNYGRVMQPFLLITDVSFE